MLIRRRMGKQQKRARGVRPDAKSHPCAGTQAPTGGNGSPCREKAATSCPTRRVTGAVRTAANAVPQGAGPPYCTEA
ncbi:hypothetical protein chiPu_0021316 [Chiloscyllium punctatum]|uniref:Uncharacterized protein n=1 Tax=Chiloscyllium punctatum TaxID=137246 RepID=A0A401RPU6_CHIPU|nr:hypothetical protein [Chiloscyllium punctatum]